MIIAAIPALIGAIVWVQRQLEQRGERRSAREVRNWHGYVMTTGISTWYVKVIEDPSNRWTERVVLDVVDPDGTPNPPMAHALRLSANSDGMLSRSPTSAEWNLSRILRRTGSAAEMAIRSNSAGPGARRNPARRT